MKSGRSLATQLPPPPTPATSNGLDADELQRDVGHRREEAGDRDGQGQAARAGPPVDEVGRRHVAVACETDHRRDMNTKMIG